jgi:hypothetical protein
MNNQKFRQKAKEYYKTIGRVWCPALNDYVVFNNKGFTHLLRKKGVTRMNSEQKRRLNLLADAIKIIADPLTNPVAQIKYARHPVNFWKFTGEKDGQKITVVVRQLPDGIKHFYSVYSKKQKTAQ